MTKRTVLQAFSSLVLALGVSFYASINQVGSRWMWATDACPQPEVICGQPALGPFVMLAGAIVLVFGTTEPLYQAVTTIPEVVNHE